MSNPVLREFRYRLNPLQFVLLLPLVAGGFCLLLYLAICHFPKPLRFNGVTLSPAQMQTLMWALTGLAAIGLGFIVAAFVSSLARPSRIALTADAIVLPKPNWRGQPWGKEEIELPLDEITSVEVVPFVGFAVQLQIIHSGGQINIPSNMLPSRREFNLLAQLLPAAIDNRFSVALTKRYTG